MAEVTMKYLGSPLNLTNDMFPTSKLSEIQIIQQHSGASTICVFRELLPANSKCLSYKKSHSFMMEPPPLPAYSLKCL